MAETIEEFFDDEDIRNSKLAGTAVMTKAYFSGSVSAAETATSLISFFNNNDEAKLFQYIAWIVLPMAEQLPETHETLIQLLTKLKCLLESEDNKQHRLQLNELSLKYELDERGLRYGDPDPDKGALRNMLREEWTNVNRFAALVHKAGLEDLSAFAKRTITFAIRRGGWRVNWKGDATTSNQLQALEGHAGAAMQWLLECAHSLYSKDRTVKESWNQWEGDLQWIVEQTDLCDKTRLLCQEALTRMRDVRV
ncbi:hypothetical protein O181_076083 [Austropuccinia psidii MF-1]|uniref:Uncharacterized protein n=1 Tax=Austropuccinia psidii MF-1 TaxID=1389203 RepID=A0A9Q3FE91_9BASI|nr:hypothetical protein [Austropuccinia psidii MF-1]